MGYDNLYSRYADQGRRPLFARILIILTVLTLTFIPVDINKYENRFHGFSKKSATVIFEHPRKFITQTVIKRITASRLSFLNPALRKQKAKELTYLITSWLYWSGLFSLLLPFTWLLMLGLAALLFSWRNNRRFRKEDSLQGKLLEMNAKVNRVKLHLNYYNWQKSFFQVLLINFLVFGLLLGSLFLFSLPEILIQSFIFSFVVFSLVSNYYFLYNKRFLHYKVVERIDDKLGLKHSLGTTLSGSCITRSGSGQKNLYAYLIKSTSNQIRQLGLKSVAPFRFPRFDRRNLVLPMLLVCFSGVSISFAAPLVSSFSRHLFIYARQKGYIGKNKEELVQEEIRKQGGELKRLVEELEEKNTDKESRKALKSTKRLAEDLSSINIDLATNMLMNNNMEMNGERPNLTNLDLSGSSLKEESLQPRINTLSNVFQEFKEDEIYEIQDLSKDLQELAVKMMENAVKKKRKNFVRQDPVKPGSSKSSKISFNKKQKNLKQKITGGPTDKSGDTLSGLLDLKGDELMNKLGVIQQFQQVKQRLKNQNQRKMQVADLRKLFNKVFTHKGQQRFSGNTRKKKRKRSGSPNDYRKKNRPRKTNRESVNKNDANRAASESINAGSSSSDTRKSAQKEQSAGQSFSVKTAKQSLERQDSNRPNRSKAPRKTSLRDSQGNAASPRADHDSTAARKSKATLQVSIPSANNRRIPQRSKTPASQAPSPRSNRSNPRVQASVNHSHKDSKPSNPSSPKKYKNLILSKDQSDKISQTLKKQITSPAKKNGSQKNKKKTPDKSSAVPAETRQTDKNKAGKSDQQIPGSEPGSLGNKSYAAQKSSLLPEVPSLTDQPEGNANDFQDDNQQAADNIDGQRNQGKVTALDQGKNNNSQVSGQNQENQKSKGNTNQGIIALASQSGEKEKLEDNRDTEIPGISSEYTRDKNGNVIMAQPKHVAIKDNGFSPQGGKEKDGWQDEYVDEPTVHSAPPQEMSRFFRENLDFLAESSVNVQGARNVGNIPDRLRQSVASATNVADISELPKELSQFVQNVSNPSNINMVSRKLNNFDKKLSSFKKTRSNNKKSYPNNMGGTSGGKGINGTTPKTGAPGGMNNSFIPSMASSSNRSSVPSLQQMSSLLKSKTRDLSQMLASKMSRKNLKKITSQLLSSSEKLSEQLLNRADTANLNPNLVGGNSLKPSLFENAKKIQNLSQKFSVKVAANSKDKLSQSKAPKVGKQLIRQMSENVSVQTRAKFAREMADNTDAQTRVKFSREMAQNVDPQTRAKLAKSMAGKIDSGIMNRYMNQNMQHIDPSVRSKLASQMSDKISAEERKKFANTMAGKVDSSIMNKFMKQDTHNMDSSARAKMARQMSGKVNQKDRKKFAVDMADKVDLSTRGNFYKQNYQSMDKETKAKFSKKFGQNVGSQARARLAQQMSDKVDPEVRNRYTQQTFQKMDSATRAKYSQQMHDQIDPKTRDQFSRKSFQEMGMDAKANLSRQMASQGNRNLYQKMAQRVSSKMRTKVSGKMQGQVDQQTREQSYNIMAKNISPEHKADLSDSMADNVDTQTRLSLAQQMSKNVSPETRKKFSREMSQIAQNVAGIAGGIMNHNASPPPGQSVITREALKGDNKRLEEMANQLEKIDSVGNRNLTKQIRAYSDSISRLSDGLDPSQAQGQALPADFKDRLDRIQKISEHLKKNRAPQNVKGMASRLARESDQLLTEWAGMRKGVPSGGLDNLKELNRSIQALEAAIKKEENPFKIKGLNQQLIDTSARLNKLALNQFGLQPRTGGKRLSKKEAEKIESLGNQLKDLNQQVKKNQDSPDKLKKVMSKMMMASDDLANMDLDKLAGEADVSLRERNMQFGSKYMLAKGGAVPLTPSSIPQIDGQINQIPAGINPSDFMSQGMSFDQIPAGIDPNSFLGQTGMPGAATGIHGNQPPSRNNRQIPDRQISQLKKSASRLKELSDMLKRPQDANSLNQIGQTAQALTSNLKKISAQNPENAQLARELSEIATEVKRTAFNLRKQAANREKDEVDLDKLDETVSRQRKEKYRKLTRINRKIRSSKMDKQNVLKMRDQLAATAAGLNRMNQLQQSLNNSNVASPSIDPALLKKQKTAQGLLQKLQKTTDPRRIKQLAQQLTQSQKKIQQDLARKSEERKAVRQTLELAKLAEQVQAGSIKDMDSIGLKLDQLSRKMSGKDPSQASKLQQLSQKTLTRTDSSQSNPAAGDLKRIKDLSQRLMKEKDPDRQKVLADSLQQLSNRLGSRFKDNNESPAGSQSVGSQLSELSQLSGQLANEKNAGLRQAMVKRMKTLNRAMMDNLSRSLDRNPGDPKIRGLLAQAKTNQKLMDKINPSKVSHTFRKQTLQLDTGINDTVRGFNDRFGADMTQGQISELAELNRNLLSEKNAGRRKSVIKRIKTLNRSMINKLSERLRNNPGDGQSQKLLEQVKTNQNLMKSIDPNKVSQDFRKRILQLNNGLQNLARDDSLKAFDATPTQLRELSKLNQDLLNEKNAARRKAMMARMKSLNKSVIDTLARRLSRTPNDLKSKALLEQAKNSRKLMDKINPGKLSGDFRKQVLKLDTGINNLDRRLNPQTAGSLPLAQISELTRLSNGLLKDKNSRRRKVIMNRMKSLNQAMLDKLNRRLKKNPDDRQTGKLLQQAKANKNLMNKINPNAVSHDFKKQALRLKTGIHSLASKTVPSGGSMSDDKIRKLSQLNVDLMSVKNSNQLKATVDKMNKLNDSMIKKFSRHLRNNPGDDLGKRLLSRVRKNKKLLSKIDPSKLSGDFRKQMLKLDKNIQNMAPINKPGKSETNVNKQLVKLSRLSIGIKKAQNSGQVVNMMNKMKDVNDSLVQNLAERLKKNPKDQTANKLISQARQNKDFLKRIDPEKISPDVRKHIAQFNGGIQEFIRMGKVKPANLLNSLSMNEISRMVTSANELDNISYILSQPNAIGELAQNFDKIDTQMKGIENKLGGSSPERRTIGKKRSELKKLLKEKDQNKRREKLREITSDLSKVSHKLNKLTKNLKNSASKQTLGDMRIKQMKSNWRKYMEMSDKLSQQLDDRMIKQISRQMNKLSSKDLDMIQDKMQTGKLPISNSKGSFFDQLKNSMETMPLFSRFFQKRTNQQGFSDSMNPEDILKQGAINQIDQMVKQLQKSRQNSRNNSDDDNGSNQEGDDETKTNNAKPSPSATKRQAFYNAKVAQQVSMTPQNDMINNTSPMQENLASGDVFSQIMNRLKKQRKRIAKLGTENKTLSTRKLPLSKDRSVRRQTSHQQPEIKNADFYMNQGGAPSEILQHTFANTKIKQKNTPNLSFMEDADKKLFLNVPIKVKDKSKLKEMESENMKRYKVKGVIALGKQEEDGSVFQQEIPAEYRKLIKRIYSPSYSTAVTN